MTTKDPNIDGGWAFVVMIACYVANFIYCLSTYVTGVMYMALLDRYQKGEGVTSFVGGIYLGLYCLAAPFAVMIINRFSARIALVTGGILSTVGFALSAFMPNLEIVIITAGILPGIGNCINVTTVTSLMGYYFVKWRNVVISIATLVAGLSVFVGTPFGLYIIEISGLNGFFLFLASMHAQICVCGMLSRPSKIELDVYYQRKALRKSATKSLINSLMDVSLLKRLDFISFLSSTSAWNFAYYMSVIHLPKYVSLQDERPEYISYIMMAFAVANVIGRVLASLSVSKDAHKSLYVYTVLLCLVGVATAALPLYSKTGPGVLVYSIQLGLFIGCFATMMPSLSLIFVGNTHISDANAWTNFFSGFGSILGPILAGFVYDVFKSYEYSFVLSGAILLVGCGLAVVSCCLLEPANEDRDITIYVDKKEAKVQNKEHSNRDDNNIAIDKAENQTDLIDTMDASIAKKDGESYRKGVKGIDNFSFITDKSVEGSLSRMNM